MGSVLDVFLGRVASCDMSLHGLATVRCASKPGTLPRGLDGCLVGFVVKVR